MNFYRRFLPHCATALLPLTDLLNETHRDTTPRPWSQEAAEAFLKINSPLAEAVMLALAGASLCPMTNAKELVVGGALKLFADGNWQSLGFFSKKLAPARSQYSSYERELLGMYLAIKHVRHYLEGWQFQILTDHKPITCALQTSSNRLSSRESRHLSIIAEFTSHICHSNGTDNSAADAFVMDTLLQRNSHSCGFRRPSGSTARRPRDPEATIRI